jgi:hypothetical protein
VFSNGSFKSLLLNGSGDFLDLTFALTFALTFTFLLSPITFAPTDCPSYRSLILIKYSKNKYLKTKFHGLPTPFHLFSYIKREMREKEERRKKKERRETEEIKTEIRPSQLQTTITFDRKLRLRRLT